MKKFFLASLAFLAIFFSGCGYKVGSLMHPQIKSIAIAPVTNDTMMYNVAAQMRGLLCECFQSDGSLKLVSESAADCILYAKVTNATFNQISWSNSDEDFLPNQWGVTITGKMTVMLPGRATPLIKETSFSGQSQFTGGPDLETSRTLAIRQACFEAAKQAVAKVTEAW